MQEREVGGTSFGQKHPGNSVQGVSQSHAWLRRQPGRGRELENNRNSEVPSLWPGELENNRNSEVPSLWPGERYDGKANNP